MANKIAIIGAGNLASRVSIELFRNGSEIVQVYSRTIKSASKLASEFDCDFTNDTSQISPNADIYLIAVSDMALDSILETANFNNKLIAHTAGSVPMKALAKYSQNYGVFYPLQTFSKNREIEFENVPFCIEANNSKNEGILMKLAATISGDVRKIDSEQRKQLHLAAVFACNFVNHMYALAFEMIKDNNLSFDILRPLIAETAAKIEQIEPGAAQTGPAVRMDMNVIQKHLDVLSNKPGLSELYEKISLSINQLQEKHKTQ
jgi:predicted short-subunit dehydrogenase-like oxidoreductase (DUF2520 family)